MLQRLSIDLQPDKNRVVCLPYNESNKQSVTSIFAYVKALDEEVLTQTYNNILKEFENRHLGFQDILDAGFSSIEKILPEPATGFSLERKRVLGSYFLKEYSIEVAALFNPSMVVHPQQDDPEKTKILMSLRATGEGHISSIEFVEGYIDKQGNMTTRERGTMCALPRLKAVDVEKSELEFNEELSLDEQVIVPLTPDESNGIEDVRFVEFTEESGEKVFYGTFTAFDGRQIKSKLISTQDFKKFEVCSMSGAAIKDKGMALFPRKVNGQYVMISRQDTENIRIMFSDDLMRWEESELLLNPQFPWQFGKLGNCGSPIETEKGWLLLTHGVGPIRKYMMGAILLDKDDPRKVIAQTKDAMLSAKGEEREGYVPNVVYSCGGIVLKDKLYIPFAVSDISSSVVSVDVDALITSMIEV